MKKKLESELTSIAHSILRMNKKDDVKVLKQKAYDLYEKLTVLSFIENFVDETPQNTKTVAELIEEYFPNPQTKESVDLNETIIENDVVENLSDDTLNTESEGFFENPVDENIEEINEDPIVEEVHVNEELIEEEDPLNLFNNINEDVIEEDHMLKSSLEKEFENTVSLDVATDMFENATRVTAKKSINDLMMNQKNLQIDLNDRIAFVKHLFDNSQEEFNRVISQLNTMTTEDESLSFVKMVKKEYDWSNKEVYENRLILLIERKFN